MVACLFTQFFPLCATVLDIIFAKPNLFFTKKDLEVGLWLCETMQWRNKGYTEILQMAGD